MDTRDSQASNPFNETGHVYTSVRSAGNVSVTLPRCAFYEGRYGQPVPSGGVYVIADARATFGESDIGAVLPKPGDRHMPPGGRAHVVVNVVHARRNQFYKVVCRDLVLAADLRSVCDLLRYVNAPGADLLKTQTETTLAASQPCRLQPLTMQVEDDTIGGEASRSTYRLFIDTTVELLAEDVVKVGNAKYKVTGQANRDQFDTLVTVDVQKVA